MTASMVFAASPATPVGLGEAKVASYMHEPLIVEFPLKGENQENSDKVVSVRIPPAHAFEEIGLRYDPALNGARVTLLRKNGDAAVRIETTGKVQDLWMPLLVEIVTPAGTIRKHANLLFDPNPRARTAALENPASSYIASSAAVTSVRASGSGRREESPPGAGADAKAAQPETANANAEGKRQARGSGRLVARAAGTGPAQAFEQSIEHAQVASRELEARIRDLANLITEMESRQQALENSEKHAPETAEDITGIRLKATTNIELIPATGLRLISEANAQSMPGQPPVLRQSPPPAMPAMLHVLLALLCGLVAAALISRMKARMALPRFFQRSSADVASQPRDSTPVAAPGNTRSDSKRRAQTAGESSAEELDFTGVWQYENPFSASNDSSAAPVLRPVRARTRG